MKPKIYEAPYPQVLIDWSDACMWHGWRPVSEALTKNMDTIRTIGFLLFESDDLVKVVQSYGQEDSRNEMQVDSILVIPQGWINEMLIYPNE